MMRARRCGAPLSENRTCPKIGHRSALVNSFTSSLPWPSTLSVCLNLTLIVPIVNSFTSSIPWPLVKYFTTTGPPAAGIKNVVPTI